MENDSNSSNKPLIDRVVEAYQTTSHDNQNRPDQELQTEQDPGLKTYKVFKNYDGNVYFVKQGFCWPAFFIPPLWALIKKVWNVGFILLGINILMYFFSWLINQSSFFKCGYSYCDYRELHYDYILASFFLFAVNIIIRIVVALDFNKWYEKNLLKRGYEQVDSISGQSLEMIKSIYKRKQDEATNKGSSL